MTVTRRAFLALVTTLSCATVVLALDWPGPASVVVGEFGTPMNGHPLPGLVLAGEGLEIRSAAKGEISFARETFDSHTVLPSAMGAVLASDGADGIAELYAYLPQLTDASARSLVQGSLIGKSTAAGLASFPGYMFALYDRRSGRWVNPRLFLPASADKKAPVVRRASLEGRDKSYVLGEQRSLPQGSYSLMMEIAEQGGNSSESVLGPPYYLRVLLNGEKLVELKAEVASTVAGRLSFYPDTKGGDELLDDAGRIRLPQRLFARGRLSIEILVRDFAGNERSAGWTLTVE